MRRTKLRIASVATGVVLLLGGLTSSAQAERRRVVVTFVGGRQVPYTVDVAPGSTVTMSALPDDVDDGTVLSIVDLGSIEVPTTPTTTTTTQETTPPAVTTGTTPPSTTTAPATTGTTILPPTITGTPGTTSTATTPTPGTVPTDTTPTTTTGTTGTTTGKTGTTPTTPGTTTNEPPAVGGVVGSKSHAKHEGSRADGSRGGHVGDDDPAAGDVNRDGVTTPGETADTPPQRNDGEQPTPDSPGFTVAPTLDAPSGVPNFFIEQYSIPPFLLPIYQAAATEYGIPWQVLAAINEIETDYGRNLSVSTAGALGWMQFMPATWDTYGVDANGDGVKDPYNPVDAIFAAARYLKAAGGDTNIEQAVFAYNHADWYVNSVMLRARLIGGMPADLVGSLAGLTQGRFPVAARATYADSIDTRTATRRVTGSNAAVTVEGDPTRHSINVYARSDAPVVAVNDGEIVRLGENDRLGRFVVLQDVYGNRYTYSHLGSVASKTPVLKGRDDSSPRAPVTELEQPDNDPTPTQPATDDAKPGADAAANGTTSRDAAGSDATARDTAARNRDAGKRGPNAPTKERVAANGGGDAAAPTLAKERLFANPFRPKAFAAGGERQMAEMGIQATSLDGYFSGPVQLDPANYVLKPLQRGSTVIAGTIIGRVGKTDARLAPHLEFQIRPAGRDAPQIDPKPILDGWKLLEATAVYKAGNRSVFGADGANPSVGQILLMTKEELEARVLADPNVDIYQCGRDDIRAGLIDRRVLATIEFLVASGLKPTITNLECGHSYLTASGNVSEHSAGDAVDIGAVNGIVISPATQGPGSITDITIRRLLTLQGVMKPHQIISLMTYPEADNTLSLPDHANHIHVGFYAAGNPESGDLGAPPRLQTLVKPDQWTKLMRQISGIENPVVPTSPSRYAIQDGDDN
ncbi:MAG TPA: lytic murein transglycosylase [Conexibacter sp.]